MTHLYEDLDILVTSDGKFFRNSTKQELPIHQTKKGACFVTFNLIGEYKSKIYNATRLYALAFIPNPENLPFAHYTGDTDQLIFSPFSVVWSSRASRIKRSLDTKFKQAKYCTKCGTKYLHDHFAEGLCGRCSTPVKRKKERVTNRQHYYDELDKLCQSSFFSTLPLKSQKIIEMRKNKVSCKEVAENVGTSFQNVSRVVTKYLKIFKEEALN